MSDDTGRDLLAAEYVLGSLEGDERAEAERLLAGDPSFARAVAEWERRLTPLTAHAEAVTPPSDLWRRIESSVSPTAEILPFTRRVRFWQATTAGAVALAASLAAFIILHQPAVPRIALLAPPSGGAPVLMATADAGGTLLLRPTAPITVPGDKDLELWSLAQGETRPRSLGVLPPTGRQLIAKLAPNSQLLVSLEPKGGSPTGQPTGPVLYGGWLATAETPHG